MKRSCLKVMAMILATLLMLSMFVACGQKGEQGPAGQQGEQGIQGEKGDDGNGISSIIKTSTEGLVDTYTITFADGDTTTFTVTNGADGEQGIQGIQGVKGEDGHTPIITIQNGYWYIDGINTNQSASGVNGATGNGISNIAKTSTEGLVDTYTITYTNGTTTTFTVTNGAQGIQGIQGVPGKDGHSPVITIQDGYWYIDGVNTNEAVGEGVKGDTGNGISSIEKTKTEGLVDTYTITFTDGTTTTFTVTNGANGNDGKDGINGTNGKDGVDGEDGKDGADGKTPYIKDGYWWIGETNTNVKAEGSDGKDGQNGTNGKDGVDGEDGKDGADGQTPYIKDGYWWIGDTNTNVKAEGTDGKDGQNGTNGKDGVDGEDGKDGQDGADGQTPYIKDGYWWIGDTNTNVKAEGSDGKDGQDGAKGDKGDTGATGATGEKGDKGDAGRGIKRMWLDAELHLWVEYDDGSDPVDLGYVGVSTTEPTPTTYTVTFVDYNGTELKKETVESGKNATAPADPTREGYAFIGWDKEFNNITSDLTVTATYEKTYTEPTFVVQSVTADAGDTLTVAINVKNNPGILAMTLSLTYDDSALDLISVSNGSALSMLTMTPSKTLGSGCKFAWDGVEIEEDDITDGEILVLTFTISDSAASEVYDIVISYTEGDIYDNDINPLSFKIENGTITVN